MSSLTSDILTSTHGGDFKDIEEVGWLSVRDAVLAVNPSLVEAIDDINPGKNHTLFKIKYPYGAGIVNKGVFHLPTRHGKLLSIKDAAIPEKVRKKIDYCSIPLSLVMSQSNEVLVSTSQRVVPLNFFLPGDLFGVFEVMHQITKIYSEPLWSVTAGARTVFLLPRISDAIGHNKIRREFGISIKLPTKFFEHFEIFKTIAARDEHHDWKNEVLVFSKDWFDESSKQSAKLYRFLLTLCWKQLQLFRDTVESNLRWATFAEEIGNRNMKPRPYLVDMVRHLTYISHGATVAFAPAIDSSAIPIESIQKAYVEIYGLKNYLPTVMQPTKFNQRHPVYCSLAMPTILESSPHVRNAPSIMDDARDIKRLTQIFTEAVIEHHNITKDDPIASTQYDFFHTEKDTYSEISNSIKIIEEDERFSKFSEVFNGRKPCSNSPFFRGCIRIKQHKT